MMADHNPVLMIGCGRMGGAIARALAPTRTVMAFDPHAILPEGVVKVERLEDADLPDALTVVLAVKPQAFGDMAGTLAPLAGPDRLFVSIMAGISLDGLASVFGEDAAIVRTMPNTPASIGHGITAAVASAKVGAAQREAVSEMMRAAGKVVWLESEADIDAVTAVSGSGPAYFFRFTEALVRAAMAEGLAEEAAMELARQTFIGAARLAEADPQSLADLRKQVTSPGGTTAAGLAIMDGGIDALVEQVVRAAAARSRELAKPG